MGLAATFYAALAIGAPATGLAATTVCNLYVANGGSDTAAGTIGAPFATVQHLTDVAKPGQTGCLRGGSYTENLHITSPGIKLTSAPTEQATIIGRTRIMPGANGVTITRLNLNGRNTQGHGDPVVLADNFTLSYSDLTNNHTDMCLIAGSLEWVGTPDIVVHAMVISHNRIHDCGLLPATNQDHGLYIENTQGAQIIDNVIYNNADRGIQLYPNAQRSTISGNVIDGNGEGVIFGGLDGYASANNTITHNLITYSKVRYNVESWYPVGTAPGIGNMVSSNCVAGARTIDLSGGGFSILGNLLNAPAYANVAAGDYRVPAGSVCAGVLGTADPPLAPNALTVGT